MLVEKNKYVVETEELYEQLFNSVIEKAREFGIEITDEYKKVVNANLTAAIYKQYDNDEQGLDA
ncbi:MAG: hypothetical protein ISR65_14330 [Bacteriovoracaceae bacterium]|nr:hypothetical protein [Bacteriovoracaceae bacterium]